MFTCDLTKTPFVEEKWQQFEKKVRNFLLTSFENDDPSARCIQCPCQLCYSLFKSKQPSKCCDGGAKYYMKRPIMGSKFDGVDLHFCKKHAIDFSFRMCAICKNSEFDEMDLYRQNILIFLIHPIGKTKTCSCEHAYEICDHCVRTLLSNDYECMSCSFGKCTKPVKR